MGALVEATLVADDLAGVEGGAAPRGGLCGMAVEAATTEILGLLRGGIVSVLDGETGVGGEIGHGDGVTCWGGGVAEERGLGGDDDGLLVLELYGMGIVEGVKVVVGRVGRGGEGVEEGLGGGGVGIGLEGVGVGIEDVVTVRKERGRGVPGGVGRPGMELVFVVSADVGEGGASDEGVVGAVVVWVGYLVVVELLEEGGTDRVALWPEEVGGRRRAVH